MQQRRLYCEMCGAPITGKAYTIVLEGTELIVCERCYRRYMEKARRTQFEPYWYRVPAQTPAQMSSRRVAAEPASRPTIGGPSQPRQQPVQPQRPATPRPTATGTRRGRGVGVGLGVAERYEVVPNYAEIIRRARERLGWSHRVLAEKVRESERTIRRIEAGELVPTIDLARRLERALGVKLLEPVVEEEEYPSGQQRRRFYLTLGDVAEIRED